MSTTQAFILAAIPLILTFALLVFTSGMVAGFVVTGGIVLYSAAYGIGESE